jgi:hypothetical protein
MRPTMDAEQSDGPLLYNIWDARSEGMATAMEELMLHAGLFDDEPRAREIVWIMLAQRAARGLASLYLQANEFDLAQAKAFQAEWTPRGWMRPDLDLLGFEQQLYLRQPGYGTSYITGKVQLEDLMRERAHQLGDAFTLKRWFEEVYSAGIIPVSLIHWQLTGKDEEIRAIVARLSAYAKHNEAAPERYGCCTKLTRNCPPSHALRLRRAAHCNGGVT